MKIAASHQPHSLVDNNRNTDVQSIIQLGSSANRAFIGSITQRLESNAQFQYMRGELTMPRTSSANTPIFDSLTQSRSTNHTPWQNTPTGNVLKTQAWEAEDIVGKSDFHPKVPAAKADPRIYPKSHAAHNLAELTTAPAAPKFKYTKKAAKKYNIPNLALVDKAEILKQVSLYKTLPTSGGTPGYIDAFFKGEPGGRTEGFKQRPEQFCGTPWDPKYGAFLISPNPSNIPERGQSHTENASTLLEKTRADGTGFGLVAYWVPPNTYERYPTFQTLFPNVPVPPDAPQIEDVSTATPGREKRLDTQVSNEAYEARTGIKFLSIPLDLAKEHAPLLTTLKTTALTHLQNVYGCDASKEQVKLYSHGPIYDLDSCGLHIHIRVNQGYHHLESDLRMLPLDEAIKILEKEPEEKRDALGPIFKHFPSTTSGKFISYNIGEKPEKAIRNGISFEPAPNAWAIPPRADQDASSLKVFDTPNHISARDWADIKTIEKSAKKYDRETIGLVDRAGLDARWEKYEGNTLMPNFIHNFFTDPKDTKALAFKEYRNQFAATSFSETLGGIFVMPNRGYTPGKREVFLEPGNIKEETRDKGGFALVGYWVPAGVYEHTDNFGELFKRHNTQAMPSVTERETINAYKARTGNPYVTTTVDIQKEHLPMLVEFEQMVRQHLSDVYNVDERQDQIKLYMHSPVYGNKTAGLHIHVRVNGNAPAGERDMSLPLSTLMSILSDDSVTNADIKDKILENTPHTKSGKYFSYSPAFDQKQFSGIDAELVKNVWQRPMR